MGRTNKKKKGPRPNEDIRSAIYRKGMTQAEFADKLHWGRRQFYNAMNHYEIPDWVKDVIWAELKKYPDKE